MKADWKKCSRAKRRRKLCISLSDRGEIALNKEAWIQIYRPDSVHLFFNAKEQRIGIKRCFYIDPDAFAVLGRSRSRDSYVIRASRFLKYFGIVLDETVRFTDPEETKDGMWMLDLKTAFVPNKVRNHYRNRGKQQ